MDARVAWVLNLDADLELGARGSYAPTKAILAAMRPEALRLAASLLRPGDVLVDEDAARDAARGLKGRAFCPTPRATALLRRAGAEPEAHPPVDVLRAVNSRAFSSALGATLPGGTFVTSLDEALAKLGEPPPVGSAWRLKRAFGMAGRGQRVISPAHVSAADCAFVASAMRDGGVQVEPNVALVTEYAIHGRITQDGERVTGELVVQECDRHGQWLSTRRATANDDPDGTIARAMITEAHRVASALTTAGYFGPFGIDAFTYDDHGRVGWQPRSEINARYSMSYPLRL